jgi:hypothetical protein
MLNGKVVSIIGASTGMEAGHDVRDERSAESFMRDVMSMTKRINVLINKCRSRAGCEAAQS